MAERKGDGRFLRNSLGVFGANILLTVLGIGTSVISARWLGPDQRGLYQFLVVLMPTTVCNFVKLGIPQANVYFIRRRGVPASDVASNSLWMALVLGLFASVVCWAKRDWMVHAFHLTEVPPAGFLLSVIVVPFMLVQVFFLGVLQAEERFREYNIQNVAPVALGLVGMTVALIWLKSGLLGAVISQTAIIAGVTIWIGWRVHLIAPIRWRMNREAARGMLEFGRKSYVQTLAATLHLRIDQWMIAYFLDPTQLALYAIAVNLTNLLLKVPDATGTVLFPQLAGAKDEDAHAATSRVCRHTLFVTITLALGYALFGTLAIRVLYGQRYMGAVQPLMLMLPGIVMITLYLILTRNFTSRNRQGVNIAAAGAALGINVGLNSVLIPRLGIAGAAISTTVSYSAAALILLVMFVRESGYTVGQTVLVRWTEIGGYLRLARGRGLMARPAGD